MIVSVLFRLEIWVMHLVRELRKLEFFFLKNKTISKESKIKTKEHNNRQNVTKCIRKPDTNKER